MKAFCCPDCKEPMPVRLDPKQNPDRCPYCGRQLVDDKRRLIVAKVIVREVAFL